MNQSSAAGERSTSCSSLGKKHKNLTSKVFTSDQNKTERLQSPREDLKLWIRFIFSRGLIHLNERVYFHVSHVMVTLQRGITPPSRCFSNKKPQS